MIVERQRDRPTKDKLHTLDFFLIFGEDALLCFPDIDVGDWISIFGRLGAGRAALFTVRHARSGGAGSGCKKEIVVAPEVRGNSRDW